MTESELTTSVIEYLRAYGNRLCFWRNHPFGRGYRTLFENKGIPDFSVLKDGKYIGLELKSGSKQSEDQKRFERHCLMNGGYYFIVSSIDELESILTRQEKPGQ